MDNLIMKKPSHAEWLECSAVIIERLTTCVHTYSRPPHDDVFMAEKERQEKNAKTLDLLRRIYAVTDEAETPTGSLAEVAQHDERTIAGLSMLFEQTLAWLPSLSKDMQKLMKSHWFENCADATATTFFRGPAGNEKEGVGSGYPEGGRLPAWMQDMIEREKFGEVREPRKALARPQHPNTTNSAQRRWADSNLKSLRSAGRVD